MVKPLVSSIRLPEFIEFDKQKYNLQKLLIGDGVEFPTAFKPNRDNSN
jgi:hypothetical protein